MFNSLQLGGGPYINDTKVISIGFEKKIFQTSKPMVKSQVGHFARLCACCESVEGKMVVILSFPFSITYFQSLCIILLDHNKITISHSLV